MSPPSRLYIVRSNGVAVSYHRTLKGAMLRGGDKRWKEEQEEEDEMKEWTLDSEHLSIREVYLWD